MSKRLLLVDDDRLILATVGRSLCRRGYRVTMADNGSAALGIAAKAAFDLAVVDIAMPGMSGIDLGRELRARYRLPCLFLSAHSDAELIAQAIQEGGNAYLVKPLSVTQLVPAIELAIARAKDTQAMIGTLANLECALAGSHVVSMAIGVLMAVRGLSEKAAFEALRAEARRQRIKIESYCTEVVASRGGHADS